jgi:hypothetical protein
MSELPEDVQRKIVHLLEGNSETNEAQVEEIAGFVVDDDELDDIMYAHDYDRCRECGIWMRLCELQENPHDTTLYICDSCLEYA